MCMIWFETEAVSHADKLQKGPRVAACLNSNAFTLQVCNAPQVPAFSLVLAGFSALTTPSGKVLETQQIVDMGNTHAE